MEEEEENKTALKEARTSIGLAGSLDSFENFLKVLGYIGLADGAEIVALAAGKDSGRYLLRLSGGKNKFHVFGRFFQSL